MNKEQTLEEVNNLLGKAWNEVYKMSEGELEGNLHDIRMKINDTRVMIYEELAKGESE